MHHPVLTDPNCSDHACHAKETAGGSEFLADIPLPYINEVVDTDPGRLQGLAAEHHFRCFMEALGLDTSSEHLKDTPRRVAKMYLDELLSPKPFMWTEFEATGRDLVLIKDIPFNTICAHHFVPFAGVAHVAYIPYKRMAGLSKFARCVDFYAAGPQVQERLTAEIADSIEDSLNPLGVAVIIQAEHLCMAHRGVKKSGSSTTTSALRGVFKDSSDARSELLQLVKL